MSSILFIYPASTDKNGIELDKYRLGELPIGLLSLAGFLENKGNKVKIIDVRAYPKNEAYELIKNTVVSFDYIGISVMSIQVKGALIISEIIKSIDNNKKVVWGGIHPTLFPEQTIQNRFVDYAIIGDGEYVFEKLINNEKPENINGLAYKNDGVHINNTQLLFNIENTCFSYHLFDIEKYVNKTLFTGKKVRSLSISTSRGCPYKCAFCVNPILLSKKWRPMSIERVNNLVDYLIEKYNLNHIYFIDDYFFGDINRTKGIIDNLLGRDILWEANIRADDFRKRIDNRFLNLMKNSGCYSLRMGIESGSERILKMINKGIMIPDVMNSIKKCKEYNIIPLCYFMVGVPNETKDDITLTSKLIVDLYKIYPGMRIIVPGLFRPYPGGELYKECLRLGFKEPKDLDGWKEMNLDGDNINNLPWVENPDYINKVRDYLLYFTTSHEKISPKYYIPLKILGKISECRIVNDYYGIPLESMFVNIFRKIISNKWRDSE